VSSDLVVLDRLLEISLLIQEDMGRAFAGTGLTASRTHLLWELRRLGVSSQRAIADALEVSPRNVTGLVDALEHSGYLVRSPHPTDRRTTLVSLTELGETTMAQMEQDRRTLARDVVSDLDAEQVADLARTLDTVTERLRRLVAAHRPEPDGTPA
jgi:DNA-binding MarR family transcriptional regulator